MEYKEFKKEILKVNSKRVHKIRNSYGAYDYYKYYRKNKPKDPKYRITEAQYYKIFKAINKQLGEALQKGISIKFPKKMGIIELRKYIIEPRIKNGKVIYNGPVDWDKTLKLWYDYPKEKEKKTLVRIISKQNFKVLYNKVHADYNNKTFFTFKLNRELRKSIFEIETEGLLDAYNL